MVLSTSLQEHILNLEKNLKNYKLCKIQMDKSEFFKSEDGF